MGHRQTYRFPFGSYPAVRIMLLMIGGIVLAKFFQPSTADVLTSMACLFLLWTLFEFMLRTKFSVLSTHASTVLYSCLIVVASSALFTLDHQRRLHQIMQADPVNLFEWEELTVEGEVVSSGTSSAGDRVLTINVYETDLPADVSWKVEYKIRLYSQTEDKKNIPAGTTIKAGIRLYEFPERRNPHEFDYGGWLHSQGIVAHGELVSVLSRDNDRFLSWGRIRYAVLKNVDAIFSEKHASLAKALLIGYKDDLTPDTKKKFSRAGLSHIMAVSGLHVGFIVAPFWLIIPYLWGSKKGKWMGLVFLTLLLVSYAGLTGFSPSVSRASLMAWLLTYGRLFHKVRNSINLTAVAALILLVIDPQQLFSAGFQLSFSAVFIILLVMPEAKRIFPERIQYARFGGLCTIILVSIVVQLGLFPILISYFGEFSLTGPISNALVIPVLTVVVPVGLVIILISPLIPTVSHFISTPLQYTLEWIMYVASRMGDSPGGYISMGQPPMMLFLVWIFIILTISALRIPKIRWKMVILLLVAANGLIVESVIRNGRPEPLDITFLDVGQGDAIHIKTPGDKHILVDAGRWSPMGNSADQVLIPYFREKGVTRLNALILSHPHADHIGGVMDLLNEVEVDTIYQSDYKYDSALYASYMRVAARRQIPVKYPVAGDIINIDPSIRLFILGPEENAIASNPNNRSLAFKLVYRDTSALFSGDAEKEQEQVLADRYGTFLNSDLYKVGHHASNTSSTRQFLEFVDPGKAVASLSFRNNFGHPGPQTVTRLNEYSESQDYTSIEGAVLYRSDGHSFQKILWKKGSI